ncbi:MAG TPA: AAA family ATPase [Candidatus Thermoplasmatota archaeon]|nr:AAA family ATPase [Candidatus Thermoplasmatota archaeon]
MRCNSCGATNPDAARFCATCGTALARQGCTSCGAPVPTGARFCPSCGAGLAGTAPAPVATPVGENRVVTVLFADMSGSVRTTGGLVAEDAAAVVNRLLEAMVEAVRRYGGRVDRFLGDGVLAVFGAPQAHEDDPARALLAAVDIRDAVTRLGFAASVGVNTGEVYFGGVGSEAHRETTVMGPAVNLAARLQAAAGPGRVLAGETTRRLAQGVFETRTLEVHVKGIDGPVRACEVLRATGRRAKVRDGAHSPFVGREEELARLRRALDGAVGGRGHVVTLVGEAGVGKSRLLHELRAVASERSDVLWLEGRCFEMSAAQSYAPFLDVLRERIAWSPGADERMLGDRLLRSLKVLVERGTMRQETFEDAAPLLAELLSLPLGEPWATRVRGATPAQVRARTFVALREWLGALARSSPIVLVLEDLHWADELSLALVPEIFETLAGSPALVICALRPEAEHASARLARIAEQKYAGRHVDIRLSELTVEDGRRLVQGLLGERGAPEGVSDLVLARAQGNPLFVEEIVRSLRDGGFTKRGTGTPEGGFRVPESLQSVILARVDVLDESSRAFLQCASVYGRVFRPRLVASLVPEGTDTTRALHALEDRGLVYPERFLPEEEWSFKHALTQATVYGSLLKARRAELHERAGRAIEAATAAEALDQQYEELARHYDLGRDDAKAVEYHLKAGDKARRAYLNDAATSHFTKVLDRTTATPDTPARVAAHEGLADVFILTGRSPDALPHLDAALSTAPSDRVTHARLLRKRANALLGARRYDDLAAQSDRARDALGPEGWRASPAAAHEWIEIDTDLCWALYWVADWRQIDAVVRRTAPVVEAHGTDAQRSRFDFSRVLYHLRSDRFIVTEPTLRLYEAAFDAAMRTGDPYLASLMHFARGVSLVWAGHHDEGERLLLRGRDLAQRVGDSLNIIRGTVYLGFLARVRGSVEEARKWTDEGIRVTPAAMTEYVGLNEGNLAWIAWKEGKHEDARQHAERAAELFAAPVPIYPFRWLAETILLQLALDRGDLAAASRSARAMLDLSQQKLPDDLASLLEAGAKATDSGRHEAAAYAFARAVSRHRELGHL